MSKTNKTTIRVLSDLSPIDGKTYKSGQVVQLDDVVASMFVKQGVADDNESAVEQGLKDGPLLVHEASEALIDAALKATDNVAQHEPEDMRMPELTEYAKSLGLTVQVGTKKQDLLELVKKAEEAKKADQ